MAKLFQSGLPQRQFPSRGRSGSLPLRDLRLKFDLMVVVIPPELPILFGRRVMLIVLLQRNAPPLLCRKLVPWHRGELLLDLKAKRVRQFA